LYASGTVSGPRKDQRGCMLELSWGGAEPLILPDGSSRSFLEDGDEVTISATAPAAGGARIGFGAVTGRIVPARLAAGRVGPRGASRHPLAHLLAVELAHAGQQRRPGHHPNYAGTRQRLRAGSRLAGITCSRKGRTHGDSGGVR
jgi:hypothetical protein